MVSATSTNFTVAPFWYLPPVILAIMGIGLFEALPNVYPDRDLGADAVALGILVAVLIVCTFIVIVLRAERLEITPDEIIYHQMWGVFHYQRSEISYVGSNAQMAFVRLIFVQLNSKKRPFIIPAYFRDYTGWMNLLIESSLTNKAGQAVASAGET